jgi:hypothetical protein
VKYCNTICTGSPGAPPNFQRDGVLQTWLQGPNFGPLLVVDKHDMGWRQYNNVSIDTLYFSVFYGGSSPSFQAKKDEVCPSAEDTLVPLFFRLVDWGACLPCMYVWPSPGQSRVGCAFQARCSDEPTTRVHVHIRTIISSSFHAAYSI